MTSAVPTTELIAGRYRLERLLGHGGMADVYRAADAGGGPAVAVKVVRSTDPELARRLTREARAVGEFDHPGLVHLLEAGVHDTHAYMVMELVEGPTLAERLRRGPLLTDRCATLGVTLAQALAYVHNRGVVHRDVKPGNVLLGPGPRARLTDFGIAQVLDASNVTVTGTTLGTAAYMAPEQLAHHRVGPAADMWALGALLLECLTGRRLFEGAPAEVVARRLAGAAPSTEGLPASWRMVLDTLLDADPGRRPEAAEVAELMRAPVFARPWDPRPTEILGAVGATGTLSTTGADGAGGVAGPPTAVAPVPPAAAPGRRRRNRKTVAIVVAAVVGAVLLTSLGAWALTRSASPGHHDRTPPVTTTTSTTTTTTTTTTTPTPAPPVTVASASAALLGDVQNGVASGALSTGVAQDIRSELNQALSEQGNINQEESSLAQIDQTVTGAEDSGMATGAETQILLADVATLAGAMGVSNPGSTTTTTTTAPTPGGPTAPGGGPGFGGGQNF